jgi:hypothetical protein
MNGQQVGVGGSRVSRVGRQRRWSSGLHFGEEILPLAVGRGSVEEVGLAGQSGGEFVSQGEPLGMGTRAEVAEGADDFLAGPLGVRMLSTRT